jgi:hypothetical protein
VAAFGAGETMLFLEWSICKLFWIARVAIGGDSGEQSSRGLSELCTADFDKSNNSMICDFNSMTRSALVSMLQTFPTTTLLPFRAAMMIRLHALA